MARKIALTLIYRYTSNTYIYVKWPASRRCCGDDDDANKHRKQIGWTLFWRGWFATSDWPVPVLLGRMKRSAFQVCPRIATHIFKVLRRRTIKEGAKYIREEKTQRCVQIKTHGPTYYRWCGYGEIVSIIFRCWLICRTLWVKVESCLSLTGRWVRFFDRK